MKRIYTHYTNLKVTHEDLPYYVVFNTVKDAADWLLINSDAVSYNAAKTGVYYVLEQRRADYLGFSIMADAVVSCK